MAAKKPARGKSSAGRGKNAAESKKASRVGKKSARTGPLENGAPAARVGRARKARTGKAKRTAWKAESKSRRGGSLP